MKDSIDLKIVDTTLREGQQSVHPRYPQKGIVFSLKQQLQITKILCEFGVDYIEILAPVRSKVAKTFAKEVIDTTKGYKTRVLAHVRAMELDIDEALSVGIDGLNVYYNSSKFNNHTPQEKNDTILKALIYAKKAAPDKLLRFSFEDSYRTPIDEIIEQTYKIESHVSRIGLPDTVGATEPKTVEERIKSVKTKFPSLQIESHFHNDAGMSVANAYTAIKNGASFVDTTILGIGERNGITPLAGLVAACHLDPNLKEIVNKKYNLKLLSEVDQTLAHILRIEIPYSMPITSNNAFSHMAGVHANGTIKNKNTYQFLDPEVFGKNSNIIWASAVVGKASILTRAKQLGIEISSDNATIIADMVREHAKLNGGVETSEVDKIISEVGSNVS